MKEEQVLLEDLEQRRREAEGKADDLKVKFDELCGMVVWCITSYFFEFVHMQLC